MQWNDETILIRPIRPEDEPQHRLFIEALQPEDLRFRFFSVRKELPRSELARLAQIDCAHEMAFIAVRNLPDGTSQTIGVVRGVIDPDNVDADFAVIVRSDLKTRGLGRILMRKMIAFLSGRRTHPMVGYVLRENDAMRKPARSLSFKRITAPTDADAVFIALNL